MWPGSDWLTTKAGGGENGRIEGTRRSGAWERRKVDFALLVSRRRVQATRESSCGRKWPIPRPQRVHALQGASPKLRLILLYCTTVVLAGGIYIYT